MKVESSCASPSLLLMKQITCCSKIGLAWIGLWTLENIEKGTSANLSAQFQIHARNNGLCCSVIDSLSSSPGSSGARVCSYTLLFGLPIPIRDRGPRHPSTPEGTQSGGLPTSP